jgi:hypothetical protein
LLRQHYLGVVKKFEPYSVLLDSGATPDQVKEAIVALLQPYVLDKELLQELAVSVLASEAICVGQLSSRPDWKTLLDSAFLIRERAIAVDKARSFEVICFFEAPIKEAQRKYSLQIVFEQSKEGLHLDEYAFEMFRLIGALLESSIQPFLKELYCLALVANGLPVDPPVISRTDFGRIVEQFEKLLNDPHFVSPPPWNVRLNQWRNIAQHHSYKIDGENIVAHYGKSEPPRQIEISRDELFSVSKELLRRLGAMKSSRELTTLNYLDELRPLLPKTERDIYCIATELGAAFATQGFTLIELKEADGHVVAQFVDAAPQAGPLRHIHCSQFIVPIAHRFPGVGVEVHLQPSGEGQKQWAFSASAEELERILKSENPLLQLAEVVWPINPSANNRGQPPVSEDDG